MTSLDKDIDLSPADMGVGPTTVGGRWVRYIGELPFTAIGGQCAISGKQVEPGVVFYDIGFQVLRETPLGDLCLAEEYIVEMAVGGAGLIKPDVHQATVDLLEAALATIADQEDQIRRLEQGPASIEASALDALSARIDDALAQLPKPKAPRRAADQQSNPPKET